MTERWDVRWNDLKDRLRAFATQHDEGFVAAFADPTAGDVEIRRSAPTDEELAAEYTAIAGAAGFGGPSFRQVPVSARDERAIDRLILDAASTLEAAGIRV